MLLILFPFTLANPNFTLNHHILLCKHQRFCSCIFVSCWNFLLTCDDEFPCRGAELGLPRQPVLGPALVGLEPVLGGHVPDLELARGQDHVLAV